jgi:hypothetical protein
VRRNRARRAATAPLKNTRWPGGGLSLRTNLYVFGMAGPTPAFAREQVYGMTTWRSCSSPIAGPPAFPRRGSQRRRRRGARFGTRRFTAFTTIPRFHPRIGEQSSRVRAIVSLLRAPDLAPELGSARWLRDGPATHERRNGGQATLLALAASSAIASILQALYERGGEGIELPSGGLHRPAGDLHAGLVFL